MLLRRLGNKQRNAAKYAALMPPHKIYFEPFFGAGGMFFNKPPAQYSYLNDIDNDVYNLFQIVYNTPDLLRARLEIIPYHIRVWDFMKAWRPAAPIDKAVRFLVLSNWGYMGKPDNICFDASDSKGYLLKSLSETVDFLLKNENVVQFNNSDFRRFFADYRQPEEISKGGKYSAQDVFVFNDPPYLGTTNNYDAPKWTENDLSDLFAANIASKCNFGICEFDHPAFIELAKSHGLHLIAVGERVNMKNRRVEMYATNYVAQPKLF